MATIISFGALDKYINARTAKQPPLPPDSKRINKLHRPDVCGEGGLVCITKHKHDLSKSARRTGKTRLHGKQRERERWEKRKKEKEQVACY